MAFKFSKNIKIAMLFTEGEIVLEFRRPTNAERNEFLHAQLAVKETGAKASNIIDEIRTAFYDKFVEAVYIEKDGKREEIVGDDDQPLQPKDFPEDVKKSAVINAFETSKMYAKNC